jgi:hypothetical protein
MVEGEQGVLHRCGSGEVRAIKRRFGLLKRPALGRTAE